MDLEQLTDDQRESLRKEAIRTLWEKGDLRYKLDATQKRMRAAIDSYDPKETKGIKMFYVCSSRRIGKTDMLFGLGVETCLKNKNARVTFCAPFANDAAEIVSDIATRYLDDAPEGFKPEYKSFERCYKFPNGSVLRLRGINSDAYQQIRGKASDLVILDEVGSMDNLSEVVQSVILPSLLSTDGRLIMATTPSVTPDHDSKRLYDDCVRHGAYINFTIRDAVRYDRRLLESFLIASGETPEDAVDILDGKMEPKTTAVQREYFCSWVTDAASAVVKEFTVAAQREIVKSEMPPRPANFDAYVSIDLGYGDKTAILYGYWDWPRGKLVIEAEDILDAPNTDEIAETLKRRERELWGLQKPYMRLTDIEPRFVADMANIHKMILQQARRADSLAAVNQMRLDVQERVLEISAHCLVLIEQLRSGTWNKRMTDFTRTSEHHLDALAALKYLCRAVNRTRNPTPSYPNNHAPVAGKPFMHVTRGTTANSWWHTEPSTPLGRKLAKRRK